MLVKLSKESIVLIADMCNVAIKKQGVNSLEFIDEIMLKIAPLEGNEYQAKDVDFEEHQLKNVIAVADIYSREAGLAALVALPTLRSLNKALKEAAEQTAARELAAKRANELKEVESVDEDLSVPVEEQEEAVDVKVPDIKPVD